MLILVRFFVFGEKTANNAQMINYLVSDSTEFFFSDKHAIIQMVLTYGSQTVNMFKSPHTGNVAARHKTGINTDLFLHALLDFEQKQKYIFS